jgi:hypothetical protein
VALAQSPEPPPVPEVPPGTPGPAAAADRNARRLFQRFVEDAAVAPGGWIEGQVSYENLPGGTRFLAGPVLAFKIVPDVEAGLRFGYVRLDPDAGPAESGLSDLDLYLKYRLPGGRERFALGALVKAPTADETRGLGTGAADIELFGAFRADLDAVTLVASAGARFNGNPEAPSPEGKDSLVLGAGILMPATPRFTLTVEGTYESRRLAGGSSDARLTVGAERLGKGGRGGIRGAVALPLSDGAPDFQVLFGPFLTY